MTVSALPMNAPGRECVGIGLVPQALTDIGALSPRRKGQCVGGLLTGRAAISPLDRLAGGPIAGSPALFHFSQSLDGLAQGSAGAIVGIASVHAPITRAGREACHGAPVGRAAP